MFKFSADNSYNSVNKQMTSLLTSPKDKSLREPENKNYGVKIMASEGSR